MIACSTTNLCAYFGYPVNWIIEYPGSATFSATVTSVLPITNGIYAGDYAGIASAYSNGGMTLFKGDFVSTYAYIPIATYYFQRINTEFDTLHKGV